MTYLRCRHWQEAKDPTKVLRATCQARKKTKRKGLIIGAQLMKVKEVINVTSFKEEVKQVINVHCSIRVCAREHTHTHRGPETERERHVCLDTPHTQHSLWPHEQYKQNIHGCDPWCCISLLTVILNLPQGICHRFPILFPALRTPRASSLQGLLNRSSTTPHRNSSTLA